LNSLDGSFIIFGFQLIVFSELTIRGYYIYVTAHTKRVFLTKKMGFHFLIDFYVELDVDSIAKVVSSF